MGSSIKKEKSQGAAASLVTSVLSLAFMALVLAALVSWNEGGGRGGKQLQTRQRRILQPTVFSSHISNPSTPQRNLFEDEKTAEEGDALDITDDATRSATCKHYLYQFLNGTTDANDECQAFKNAFNAADCKDDDPAAQYNDFRKRNESANDDLYIDDFFENWEVRSVGPSGGVVCLLCATRRWKL